ncbi:MAG TPA: helix-turn-helix transcriptional regulator [Burkholderiaceae bacterium]|nr:helix-turn-helix transcriptional regulator [Burkholderiaceae bacterium]
MGALQDTGVASAAGPGALAPRFGRVVRELREARGWSQERLASRAELNRSYMGEVERAAAMPSLATAEKLARALDISLSEIFLRCEAASASRE